jgi:hypothetical protein
MNIHIIIIIIIIIIKFHSQQLYLYLYRVQQQVYEDKLNELSSRELMVERTNKTVQAEIQKIRDGKLNEYIKGSLHFMMRMIMIMAMKRLILLIMFSYDDNDNDIV